MEEGLAPIFGIVLIFLGGHQVTCAGHPGVRVAYELGPGMPWARPGMDRGYS